MSLSSASLGLLLFSQLILVRAAPVDYSTENPTTSASRFPVRSTDSCGFVGNPDFYGLGIRIAIYLQWVTSFAANHLLGDDSVKGYLETNTIFLVAVFVALAVSTADEAVRSAEILVLLQLAFGFIFSILSIWGYRTSSKLKDPIRFPLLGSFFRLSLVTAICAYSVWFWFKGLQTINDKSCPSYIFLFARADSNGGVRYLFRAQSVLALAAYAVLLLVETIMIIALFTSTVFLALLLGWASAFFHQRDGEVSGTYLFGVVIKQGMRSLVAMSWSWANGKNTSGTIRPLFALPVIFMINCWIFVLRTICQFLCLLIFKRSPPIGFPSLLSIPGVDMRAPSGETKPSGNTLDRVFLPKPTKWLVRLINIVAIFWAITSIEFTLRWNSVSGVFGFQSLKTTGQLIPLIISMLGLLRLIHAISVQRSDIQFADVLIGLLENGSLISEHPEGNNPSQALESEQVIPTAPARQVYEYKSILHYSLNKKYEATFKIRKPDQRHSLEARRLEDGGQEMSSSIRCSYEAIPPRSVATKDPGHFQEDEIEIHNFGNGQQAFFVKDSRTSGIPSSHLYPPRDSTAILEVDNSPNTPVVSKESSAKPSNLLIFLMIMCGCFIICMQLLLTSLIPGKTRERFKIKLRQRATFAIKEYIERLGKHVLSWNNDGEKKQRNGATPRKHEIEAAVPQQEILGRTSFVGPHRRKKEWGSLKDTEQIKEAWKERSLYRIIMFASETLAMNSERVGFVRLATAMRKFAGSIQAIKVARQKFKEQEIRLSREQHYEDISSMFVDAMKAWEDVPQEEFSLFTEKWEM